MKKLLNCAAVLLVFMFFALPAPIFAQEEKGVVTMEETVVTATRDKEEIRKIPANVSVVTAKDIEESGATSIVEVLENLESINFVSWSGNPSQAYIDMRGFGGDNPFGKTLIMLDGRRLNRPDMAGVNWLQIPVGNIEKIEVIRGASSVLYGDSAVAGVINIITKRGEGKPDVNASVIAGSYGLHDERVGITGSYDRLSYALTGENQKTFGYRERSKFASKGAGLNLGYDASDYFDIFLGVSFNKTDFDMPGCLTKAQMEQDRKQYQPGHSNDDASNEYSNINLKMKSFLGNFGRFDVNFMYGNKDIKNNMESNWAPNKYNVADIDTFGITPKYILGKDVFGHGNKLILGLDYYHEKLDIDKYSDRERISKTHTVDLEKNTLGYYIRDELDILEKLILSVGYRTERGEIKGSETTLATATKDFDDKKIHKGEAYEAGLTYLIGEKSKIFTKYAQVYRYPFLDEQASYWGFGGDTFLTDLEKEKGESFEVGTQFNSIENMKIGLTFFRIDMEDEIVYNNSTSRNENLDKTSHEGAEFSISYKLEKLGKFYGNFTYHDAEFTSGQYNGKKMFLVPKEMANAGLEIYLPYAFMLRPEMRYVGKCYQGGDKANTSEQMNDYTLYDFFLFYRPEFDNFKISAFLGVENFTDEKHSVISWGGYYPQPGIAAKGGISFMF
ncbi:MAG: iron complex outermembrane recepter protein [Desulfobacteraceae bacterium Eth-SRB1]|nr:MAG: iron complex outermembrane recepter protein [Desulfobacteraceae bacterium Eth-SRB1]